MFVSRNQPKGARLALFGLGLCIFALMPTEIGYQDIASLLARQPGVAERWQKRVFASAVGSIQVATYSFGRPIGTSAPQDPQILLARLDSSADVTGAVTRNPITTPPPRYQASDFPKVDRTLKGDRLVVRRPDQVEPAEPASAAPSNEDPATSNSSVRGMKTAAATSGGALADNAPLDPELQEALRAPP
ncbi:MAG: cell wall hydrolase, partial [Bradyrhizobium sp.]